ncbi:fimbrial protein FimV [Acinetobacter sp.]|uniref:fimbrial protein FimV n=1 Tax=Acinetobacter sp. TaxID=472 RepID=UPI0035B0212D
MLIYVIPFVILLIVLVVLKKRQDAQGSDKTTAATPKAKAKKAGSSARAAPNKTLPVQDAIAEKKQTTPLSDDVRSKIESLTQERNFFSAEAQINQALKKDNTQHELYLYLLEIHILQKDEFAISQLLNHLRSLELDGILEQAEAKKASFDKSQNAADEAIAFTRTSFSPEPVQEAPKAQNNADFDALMAGAPAAETKAGLAFDQLHLDPAPQAAQPAAKAAEEIKPLDFNLSFEAAPKPEAPAPEAVQPLDFGSFSLENAQPEIKAETPVPAPAAEIKPLDFSLDLAPEAKAEAPAPAAEIKPLDFSLDLAPEAKAEAAAPAEIKPLDFSLNLAPEAKAEAAAPAAEIKPLDFSLDSASEAKAEPAAPAQEIKPLDFSFAVDAPEPAETPAAAPLNFELASLEAPAAEPAAEAPPAPAGVSFDLSSAGTPAIPAADKSDPLLQSFPELAEVNEAALNLELAQQYIELGSFDAARDLLAEKQTEYSQEQRQQADLLLNQIAS